MMPSTLKFRRPWAVICACALVAFTGSAQAKTAYHIIRSFAGLNGEAPGADLSFDNAGNLYGTTQLGGSRNVGTVFKIAPNGKETVLHSFKGKDGSYPSGGVTVIGETGDLYGTTKEGGRKKFGTIWHIGPDGSFATAHNFDPKKDGSYVTGRLIPDSHGNLYGIAEDGDTGGYGTVYTFTSHGSFRVLYNFTDHADGGAPVGSLIMDTAGNLYGTTQIGGTNDNGTVFVVSGEGIETVLYRFTGGNDGSAPSGALVRDAAGTLYGTANRGGSHGYGTVFSLTADGTFSTVYSFAGGNDGAYPVGNLLQLGDTLYGTTVDGGGSCNCGTVYDVTTGGHERILHSFAGPIADGANPSAGLISGANQLLYGTTSLGGVDGDGTVFRIGE